MTSREVAAALIAGALACLPACTDGDEADGATSPTADDVSDLGPALTATAVPGRGATVPFVEYEAEDAATNGAVLAMNRNAGTLAGEASGRRAVTLSGQGQFVEFTLTAPANAIVVRYSIPDSPSGTGIDATLALYVNGVKNRELAMTSRYAWYYGSYPFTNRPGDGRAHHFYDETRALLGVEMAPGTRVKLQVDRASNTAPSYTIDLADFERVAAPAPQPAGSLSVTQFGATAGDASDDAAAFDAAVAAARGQGREVWIPPGVFMLGHHITVDRVTIRGAGMWHSELRGRRAGIFGLGEPSSCGIGGNSGRSAAVQLRDFAIIGEVTERVDCDQANAIGGALGGGSVVSGLWIQHTKVGLWLDGPFDGLTVTGNRILDQTADGLNLHQGISNVTVTNNFVRNSGDDGLAMWSEREANHDNTFSFNTVVAPILANGIAIYGGRDIRVTDNVIAETQDQGGGIHVANRFSAVPLAGTTTVSRNTTIRCGVLDSNWQFGVGAIWFDGRDSALTGTINVVDTDLIDSNYEAIQFIDSPVTDIHFQNVTIQGAGTFALQLQSPGTATFANVRATAVGVAGIYNCQGSGAFTIVDRGGNSGWTTTFCGGWPPPVYGGDGGGGDDGGGDDGGGDDGGDGGDDSGDGGDGGDDGGDGGGGTGNLALHRPVAESSHTDVYVGSNATDGNQATYWESANNAFPQSLTVDLGTAASVSRVALELPTGWGARTQTLSIQGSTSGSTFTTLVGSRGVSFDPASANTATLTFAPASVRFVRVVFTANTGWPAGQLSELAVFSDGGGGGGGGGGNLALNRPVTESSHTDIYVARNAIDGNQSSYWESASNAFPQNLTVDLGAATQVGRVVLKLPIANWGARTQTVSVLGSSDGASYTTIVSSRAVAFDATSANTATIPFAPVSTRFLRLVFTGNTGWPAGQLSELEVFAP